MCAGVHAHTYVRGRQGRQVPTFCTFLPMYADAVHGRSCPYPPSGLLQFLSRPRRRVRQPRLHERAGARQVRPVPCGAAAAVSLPSLSLSLDAGVPLVCVAHARGSAARGSAQCAAIQLRRAAVLWVCPPARSPHWVSGRPRLPRPAALAGVGPGRCVLRAPPVRPLQRLLAPAQPRWMPSPGGHPATNPLPQSAYSVPGHGVVVGVSEVESPLSSALALARPGAARDSVSSMVALPRGAVSRVICDLPAARGDGG